MTITFISNYINHHQLPFSDAMYSELGEDYCFIQTVEMDKERVDMGWGLDDRSIPYVMRLYDNEYECLKKIVESDIALLGWTQRPDVEEERLKTGKPTIRISERIYREGQWKAVSPRGLAAKYKEHIKYRNKAVYLLCAGAYAASDFHLIGAYPGKMYKWGYFPRTRTYSKEELEDMKKERPLQLVWAGRFIPLKHPEYVVRLAGFLRDNNYDFRVHMLGSGEMEADIKGQVLKLGLQDKFLFYGYTGPEKVRDVMEKCHIHLFTSNCLEGWGAVVNEGMNSGCVEVAGAQAGAVPYLIRHGENGLIYRDNSYSEMEILVKDLFDNWEERKYMGYEAYRTIVDEWNPENAAKELLRFARSLMKGEAVPAKSGPLSPARVISLKNPGLWG